MSEALYSALVLKMSELATEAHEEREARYKAEAEREVLLELAQYQQRGRAEQWARAEKAEAELEDYRHMPCEECLTFAPGPEFVHLKAEKDAYMDRAFKAEAALAAAEPVITAALAWRESATEVAAGKRHRYTDALKALFAAVDAIHE